MDSLDVTKREADEAKERYQEELDRIASLPTPAELAAVATTIRLLTTASAEKAREMALADIRDAEAFLSAKAAEIRGAE